MEDPEGQKAALQDWFAAARRNTPRKSAHPGRLPTVAEIAEWSGVSRQTVSDLANASRGVTGGEVLARIAEALRVPGPSAQMAFQRPARMSLAQKLKAAIALLEEVDRELAASRSVGGDDLIEEMAVGAKAGAAAKARQSKKKVG